MGNGRKFRRRLTRNRKGAKVMRYLKLRLGQHDVRYKTLYDGLIASQRGFADTELRIIGNVLDKVESFGTPQGEGDRAFYALSTEGVLALEDAEHKLLLEAFNKVSWTARGARDAANTKEWLETAPTEPPVDVEVARRADEARPI